MAKKHIAIFSKNLIDKVFKTDKRVDVRLAQKAIAPYQKAERGDKILIKKSGGDVYGEAQIENVLFFGKLDKQKISRLKRRYQNQSKTSDQFWKDKINAKYASIIFLSDLKRYLSPVNVDKSDRSGWKVIR